MRQNCVPSFLLFLPVFLTLVQGQVEGIVSSRPDKFRGWGSEAETSGWTNPNSGLSTANNSYNSYGQSHRQSRLFFPFFTVIRFANDPCRTTNNEMGICYTRQQCSSVGGTAQGTCAQGIGVCCKIVATCGGVIMQNGTSIQSPQYPSKYNPSNSGPSFCQIQIRRPQRSGSNSVGGLSSSLGFPVNQQIIPNAPTLCQIKLNFISFDIDGPTKPVTTSSSGSSSATNDAGNCRTDSLVVSSAGGAIQNLCGVMTGQHLYIDFGSSDTISLNILLSGAVQRERLWNIEVLMIPCNSPSKAPPGCLQYFTGVTGQVQSFNFAGGTHLGGMDYSVCIRPEDGMRYIDWSPCNPGDVKIDGGASDATTTTTPLPCNFASGRSQDYLTIMGGISFGGTISSGSGATSTTDRFCDVTWPKIASPSAYVRSSVKPFLLHFTTDMLEITLPSVLPADPVDASAGFCLKWQQNPQ